jgi:hypothetical protein
VPPISHFTDISNIAPILAAGELRCHSTADCAVDVADATNQGATNEQAGRLRPWWNRPSVPGAPWT